MKQKVHINEFLTDREHTVYHLETKHLTLYVKKNSTSLDMS